MDKFFSIVFLLFSNQIMLGQQILKCNERLTDIDLVCEYFSDLDSAFAAKNKISEIMVTESYFNRNVLKYSKTKLHYKYNAKFKKIYMEVNAWTEDGILHRGDVVLYFKDTILNSQLIRNSFNPQQSPSYTKYLTKLYWINDTLLKKDSYTFLDDSLYRHEDFEIEDTRAMIRDYEKLKKNKVEPFEIIIQKRSDIVLHEEPDFLNANPHNDIVKKDSLGRVTEIESFFVTEIGGKRGSFPEKKIYIEYLDSTKFIKGIREFDDFNTNKKYFEDLINSDSNISWNYFWPKNYIHNNLYFEYTAIDFKFGIPQLIIISTGKDSTIQRRYKTVILTK